MKLWVASYSASGGLGLYPVTRSPAGDWSVGEPFEGAANASFGTWSARHRLHYLVDEEAGLLVVYRHADDWRRLAVVPTGGSEPCHVSLSPDEAQLAVANYGDGSIALFSLDANTGLPSRPPDVHRNSGNGPHPDRQTGPHAHCVTFDPAGRWLYAADLGTDEILALPVESGLGEPRVAFRAPPSSGPRHLMVHPSGDCCFLVSELASTLQLLRRDGAGFTALQCLSTLPDGAKEESLGGHLGIDAAGNRAYVTNRGHDSIATFAFEDGKLSPLQHQGSGGAAPRHFLLLEEQRMMVVAHEEGGNVTGFALQGDGTPGRQIFDLAVPGAAFLFRDMAG